MRARSIARFAPAFAVVAAIALLPGAATTGASFTAQASTEQNAASVATLTALTGVTAERSPSGIATISWDEPLRPDVATGYQVERLVDGVATVIDAGDGFVDASTTVPPIAVTAEPVGNVDVGMWTSCAVAGGSAYCWGDLITTRPLTPVRIGGLLASLTVTQLSVGDNHACAVADGAAYCWGTGTSGQLGGGTMVTSVAPVKVGGALASKVVTKVSAGSSRSCALADARVYCWGSGNRGALGNGGRANSTTPVAVGGPLANADVEDISIEGGTGCAIAAARAYCWGSNTLGNVGDGSTSLGVSTPVAVDTSGVLAGREVTGIVAGNRHVCAVADARAFCWGDNGSGQLGDGTLTSSPLPVAVDTTGALAGVDVTSLALSSGHTCALSSAAAYCWGKNGYRQLGDGTRDARSSPVEFTIVSEPITAIAAGDLHQCVLVEAAVSCWGDGSRGQLGNGLDDDRDDPTAIDTKALGLAVCDTGWRPLSDPLRCGAPSRADHPGLVDDLRMPGILRASTQLSVGSFHSCVVADGKVVCWGENFGGQLGDGTTQNRSTPITVGGLLADRTVSKVSAGQGHSCAITGWNLVCWGNGNAGQLGGGSATSSLVPIGVQGPLIGRQATDVAVGISHSCAVAGEDVYCWGSRVGGALGDGQTTGSATSAVGVHGLLDGLVATRVTATNQLGCAVAHPPGDPQNTGVYCWGVGAHGQLGNGSTASSTVPVAVDITGVLAGRTVTAIASTSWSSAIVTVCVIADGDPFCWGWGDYGELGSGSTSSSAVPVAVALGSTIPAGATTELALGGRNGCVLADGVPYCWGVDYGATPVALDLAPLAADTVVTDIALGSTHGCLIADARPYCWGGQNQRTVLGNGTSIASDTVVAVDVTGALDTGACLPGWVRTAPVVCVPAPDAEVGYRVGYRKAGWSAPVVEISVTAAEEGP